MRLARMARSPRASRRPSSSATPADRRPPHRRRASAARSAATRTPPEACQRRPESDARQLAYSARFGPDSVPSRAMSVQSTWRSAAAAIARDRVPETPRRAVCAQPCVASSGRAIGIEAHVEGEHDAIRSRPLEPGRAPRRARRRQRLPTTTRSRAGCEQCGRVLRDAHAAADLHARRPAGGEIARSGHTVAGVAVARTVEIDDVQIARAQRRYSAREFGSGSSR